MKIPLRFQITEFDCGTVSLQNAVSYLYDREDVPPELVRAISIYTVNCYDEKGNMASEGNTKNIVNNLTNWVTEFVNRGNFGISCKLFNNVNVEINAIRSCVQKGGCAFVKVHRDGDHFVIVTHVDETFVYLWDPYFIGETYYDYERKVTIIFNKPFHYNRQVTIDRFMSLSTKDYALGPIETREGVLFNKTGI